MKKKKAPLSLMQMFSKILKGKGLHDGYNPVQEASGRVIGELDPLSRSLFFERSAAIDEVKALKSRKKKDEAKIDSLSKKAEVLTFLLRESVGVKIPVVTNPDVDLRVSKDWRLSIGSMIDDAVPFEAADRISRQVFGRVLSIFTEPQKGHFEDPPSEAESNEPVIGKVTDPRIKALWHLGSELVKERDSLIPPSSLEGPLRLKWMKAQTLGELLHMGLQIQTLNIQIDQLRAFSFMLTRETVSSKMASPDRAIGLRKGWKIVTVPNSEPTPDILEMLMELGGLPEGLFSHR
ncbi:MAG: hypothetical protein KGI69_01215 [Patescibacteria group bacterium]|nr:hypothetical protein [Patescibacteria group bacterium]